MKAGFFALAAASLMGSAVAAPDYGYGDYTSPADPVKPTTTADDWGYGADKSTPAAPVKPTTTDAWGYGSKPSTPASPVKPSAPADEDCDEDEDTSTGAWPVKGATSSAAGGYWGGAKASSTKASVNGWPTKALSSGADSWPVAPAKSSPAAAAGTYVVPSYFETAWGCCKTVVTVTEWADATAAPVAAAKPSTWSTASPVTTAPVPHVTSWPSAGVYSEDAVTVTLTNTVTVVAHHTQALTSGNNVWGGSSVTVTAPTTVTCGYVAHSTSGSVLSEYVAYTTVGCETAGVYTCVPAASSSASADTTITWAVPTEYGPGTWVRPATTVTATASGQYWECPYEQAQATPSTPAAPVAPVTWSSPAAEYKAPATSTPAWSAPAAPSASPVSSTSISTNGNQWAMTYTPYTTSGQCKTASEVDADIALIKSYGFTTVRLYATDCSGLTNVGASCKAHGLKLIVGVFIDSTGLTNAWKQVDEITTWGSAGNWESVPLIVVGNEAIFNGYVSASDLAAFITKAKGAWTGAGYCGQVTTTEPVNIVQQYGSILGPVVDVGGANIHAFFTSSVSSDCAGDFVVGQLALVEAAYGKPSYNLESGWPNAGSSNGAAVASPADQKAAITDILAKAGQKTVIFSFTDDAWKDAGSFGVEQHFGCGQLFGSSGSGSYGSY